MSHLPGLGLPSCPLTPHLCVFALTLSSYISRHRKFQHSLSSFPEFPFLSFSFPLISCLFLYLLSRFFLTLDALNRNISSFFPPSSITERPKPSQTKSSIFFFSVARCSDTFKGKARPYEHLANAVDSTAVTFGAHRYRESSLNLPMDHRPSTNTLYPRCIFYQLMGACFKPLRSWGDGEGHKPLRSISPARPLLPPQQTSQQHAEVTGSTMSMPHISSPHTQQRYQALVQSNRTLAGRVVMAEEALTPRESY